MLTVKEQFIDAARTVCRAGSIAVGHPSVLHSFVCLSRRSTSAACRSLARTADSCRRPAAGSVMLRAWDPRCEAQHRPQTCLNYFCYFFHVQTSHWHCDTLSPVVRHVAAYCNCSESNAACHMVLHDFAMFLHFSSSYVAKNGSVAAIAY